MLTINQKSGADVSFNKFFRSYELRTAELIDTNQILQVTWLILAKQSALLDTTTKKSGADVINKF